MNFLVYKSWFRASIEDIVIVTYYVVIKKLTTNVYVFAAPADVVSTSASERMYTNGRISLFNFPQLLAHPILTIVNSEPDSCVGG